MWVWKMDFSAMGVDGGTVSPGGEREEGATRFGGGCMAVVAVLVVVVIVAVYN
jgi:hypothetical protein